MNELPKTSSLLPADLQDVPVWTDNPDDLQSPMYWTFLYSGYDPFDPMQFNEEDIERVKGNTALLEDEEVI